MKIVSEPAAPTNNILARIDNGFNFLLSVVSSAWIFAIMVLICIDVAMRTFLNSPISGVVEFVSLSVAACVFLQLPSTIAQHRLLQVEMVIEPIQKAIPRAAGLFNLLCMLAGAFLFWKISVWAWPDFTKAYQTGEFAGAPGAYEIPVWPFKLTLIIGAAFGFVQFVKLSVIETANCLGLRMGRSEAVPPSGPIAMNLLYGLLLLGSVAGFLAFLFTSDPRPITDNFTN